MSETLVDQMADTAWSVALAVAPLGALFLLFQLFLLKLPRREITDILVGTLIATIGLFLFLLGVEIGFLPFGRAIGATLAALTAHQARQAEEKTIIGSGYRDSGLVFTMPDGSPIHPQRISAWFLQHTRAAGLPRIRLHDVRHSYATAALAAGVPPKVISQCLGHATIAITMDTYSHVIPGLDEQAAETVARLILGDGEAITDPVR